MTFKIGVEVNVSELMFNSQSNRGFNSIVFDDLSRPLSSEIHLQTGDCRLQTATETTGLLSAAHAVTASADETLQKV